MYCKSCGKKLEGNEKFCAACGTPVNAANIDEEGNCMQQEHHRRQEFQSAEYQQEQQGYRQSQQEYRQGQNYHDDPPADTQPDGWAVASLILGIVSFFLIPVLGGILAIVFAHMSVKKNNTTNTMAKAGKILGIVNICVCAVVVLIMICAFVAGVGLLGALYH